MAITWIATVEDSRIMQGKRINRVKLTTSSSGNTYTAGGDAPPSFGDMGFVRNLDYMTFFDASQEGYLYTYDKTNNKIKIYSDKATAADTPLKDTTATTAHNSKSVWVEAVGW